MSNLKSFQNLIDVAKHLRKKFSKEGKNKVLIFAHNGTGKTRLSMDFKELGKEEGLSDTLYFNAFIEDLFIWDNDIKNDESPSLKINTESNYFSGLADIDLENRIRPLVGRYVDLNFKIDYENGSINFDREIRKEGEGSRTQSNIKISRGEENVFIWCFFLAVAELAIDGQESYKWVKYLYIDDPVSSLDDNNTIGIACHLAQILKDEKELKINTVISTHHALFFNVMWNELSSAKGYCYYFFKRNDSTEYTLEDTGDKPSFHHIALLKELHEVAESGQIYGYHFNILRNILEKIAIFHGFNHFSDCIEKDDVGELNKVIYQRVLNLLSHGGYSLYEPKELLDDSKKYFKDILNSIIKRYKFNSNLFIKEEEK